MLNRAKYLLRKRAYAVTLFSSRFEAPIMRISRILDACTGVASVVCLVALTVQMGYNLSAPDHKFVQTILRICQCVFGSEILFGLLLRTRFTLRHTPWAKWITDGAIILSLVLWAYRPFASSASLALYSPRFLYTVLAAYSFVNICYSFSKIPGRRTNPSLLMAASFLIFIIVGSFLLMLPRCTYHGISYFDSLFVSSSAVCITGLSSVDLPSTFTPTGILVLSVLVQLGSLGLLTFTSFFALFFTGANSIYNQLLLRDIIYSKSMNSLFPTLLYVLGFTITIELAGAAAVFFTIPAEMGMGLADKLVFSAFHSMSSFCNAGFSIVPDGMANTHLMGGDQSIYVVTSVLIFAGAVGFPILVNFREIIGNKLGKLRARIHGIKPHAVRVHIFDLNTKLVLCTTLSILAISSVAFFCLEYDNTLAGMSTYKKAVQSVFNSLIPRSAGFASVNPCSFHSVTLLLIMVQMAIGGSSQSMAGGVKVNTIATIFLTLRSVTKSQTTTYAFNRAISSHSLRRANAVMTLAAASLIFYLVAILLLEPALDTKKVVFEVVSALFTVGSSLGITADLCDASKAVLCTAMFLGRVGLLSILCGLRSRQADISPHLPVDSVIIN